MLYQFPIPTLNSHFESCFTFISQLMDYISNYLNNWLLGLTTTTPRIPDVTTSSVSGGGSGGGWSGGMRPPQVPGGHGVWINADGEDNRDYGDDGGSGMSGQRRGGLVSRDDYLDYVRKQEERRDYRARPEQFWG